MSLAVPARVIRAIAARWFPMRGQATFCLTDADFGRRWDGLVADASVMGYEGLLGSTRAKLEARWVRIWDEPEDAKVSQWTVGQRPAEKPASRGNGFLYEVEEKDFERGQPGVTGCAHCGRLLGRTTRHLCIRCMLAEAASTNMAVAGITTQDGKKRCAR